MDKILKYFHLVPGNPVFPRPPVQADLNGHTSIQDQSRKLFLRSCERFPAITNYIHKKLVKGTGCNLKLEDEDPEASYHIKTREAIESKALRKYNGDPVYVTDPLRYRVTFNSYAKYDRISNKLLPINNPRVLEYEPTIRFDDYDKSGFVADQIVLHDPESGLCYELQITHEAFDVINTPTHEKYEIARATEKRWSELDTQWRIFAQADMIRRAMNHEAGQRARIDAMRYAVTFGFSRQDNQTPFAAIWACQADKSKHAWNAYYAQTPKYVLTPYHASACLFHNAEIQQDIADANIDGKMDDIQPLAGRYEFMRACQHYLNRCNPGPTARHQNRPTP